MTPRLRGICALSIVLHLLAVFGWAPEPRATAKAVAPLPPLTVALIQIAPAGQKVAPGPRRAAMVKSRPAPKTVKHNGAPAESKPAVAPQEPALAHHPVPATPLAVMSKAAANTAAAMSSQSDSSSGQASAQAASHRQGGADAAGPITQAANYSAAYLNNPAPEVPYLARQRCQSGRVLLRVLVGANGKPLKVDIETGSGCEAYDRSAQQTVKNQWRFEPAKRGNSAVESEVQVPIRLNLVE
jgi:protein TonB